MIAVCQKFLEKQQADTLAPPALVNFSDTSVQKCAVFALLPAV